MAFKFSLKFIETNDDVQSRVMFIDDTLNRIMKIRKEKSFFPIDGYFRLVFLFISLIVEILSLHTIESIEMWKLWISSMQKHLEFALFCYISIERSNAAQNHNNNETNESYECCFYVEILMKIEVERKKNTIAEIKT